MEIYFVLNHVFCSFYVVFYSTMRVSTLFTLGKHGVCTTASKCRGYAHHGAYRALIWTRSCPFGKS